MQRIVFVSLILAVLAGGALAEGTLDWRTHAKALPEAAAADKPVVIHFTADWCSWCVKMKKETYTDPAVAAMMKDEFVTAMVNSDNYPLLSWYYGVQSLPTIWILDSKGDGITKIAGYKDARSFEKYLTWVSSGAYTTKSFAEYVQSEG